MQDIPHNHLSRITTLWTQVLQAHGQSAEAVQAARTAIMERYSGAVYRYLRSVLRDADAADEVFQEFALSFVQGGFRHAAPGKGRFRDYVKISILRLVSKYRKRHVRRHQSLGPDEAATPNGVQPDEDLDAAFLASCRDELMGRAWTALKDVEHQGRQPFFTVLDYRARHPQATSEQMAADLTAELDAGQPLTVTAVRKTLQRARVRFADLLLHEVSQSLFEPTREAIEQEIIDLGLHRYCRSALKRRYG